MSSKLFWFVQWHATGGPEYVDLSWNVWDFDGIWQVPPSPGFGTPRVDVAGVMHVSGDIGLRLGIPKNIVQVGAIGVTGTLNALGDVVYKVTFPFPIELPLYINPRGTLGISGDLVY